MGELDGEILHALDAQDRSLGLTGQLTDTNRLLDFPTVTSRDALSGGAVGLV